MRWAYLIGIAQVIVGQCRIFVTVQGTGGNITHEHLREVMKKVQTHMGRDLTEISTPNARLRTGQWSIDEDPAGNATGHIEILTDGKDQALHYQHILTNVVIELRHETIPLQVSGDALVAGSFRST